MAFSCKLWWAFRTGSSLWAKFLHAKYCNGIHPCQAEIRAAASATWRRMVDVRGQVELFMLWLIHRGPCDFLYDNWLDNWALYLKATVRSTLSFEDFCVQGQWDTQRLGQVLSPELISSIAKQVVPSGEQEAEAIWMPTTSGQFTLSSVYQEVRQVQQRSFVFSHLWRPSLPVKVSSFMLHLVRGRLPLDEVLCNLGFQLASKCCCCDPAAVEAVEHVFFSGALALEVWGFFNGICGIAPQPPNLRACLLGWWQIPTTSSQRRFLYDALPNWICWHIWKAINKVVFEGVQVQGREVCQAIFKDVKASFENQFHQLRDVRSFPQSYDAIVTSAPPSYGFFIVGWKPSAPGQLTLNTDGCSKGNPGMSGGGGVVRNSNSELVVAFSAFLGKQSSLRAEVLALLAGLRLCEARGLAIPSVQLDSAVLVGILQRRFHCPWNVRLEVEEIRQRVAREIGVSHCVREVNKVADALANVGVMHNQDSLRVYENLQALPMLARGELWLDKWGIPAIRRVKKHSELTLSNA